MRTFSLILSLIFLSVFEAIAQDTSLVFIAYDRLPSYMALASKMQEPQAAISWLDHKKYKGHADYVSTVLNKSISFKQFKAAVRDPANREYLPIFVHDLRTMPVTIAQKKYKWAMRVVGYHYLDGAKDMANSVLKAANAVERELEKTTPNVGKGLILLATNPDVKPNSNIAEALKKQGFGSCTVTELLQKTNGTTQKILNSGIAIGTIKYIPKGMEEQIAVSFNDIAIYDELPERVPIAAGIITFEPQTPLSHINLLAKNRGTVNIYTQKADFLSKFKFKNGDLVRLSATVTTGKSAFKIEKTTPSEQVIWQKKHAHLAVDVPAPQYDLAFISYFDIGKQNVQKTEYIGAKATNYALLQRSFKDTKWAETVRPGFAIPFYFYKEAIELSNAKPLIDSFLLVKNKITTTEKNKILGRIRKKIKHGKVSDNLIKQVRAICAKYFLNTKIRLRSSTNCEDLATFNGAGLYDSKGFMTAQASDDSLKKTLLKVYASLWNDAAFAEREFYNIDHKKIAMGILINEAYDDEWANGVIISQPNKDKKTISLYINSQVGEHLVTNPKDGEKPEAMSFARTDSDWFNLEQKSNLGKIFDENPNTRQILFDLRNITAKIHGILVGKKAGYGVDIEFKIMKKTSETGEKTYKLYIKQARLLGAVLPE